MLAWSEQDGVRRSGDPPGTVKIGDENGGLLDRLRRTGAHIDI